MAVLTIPQVAVKLGLKRQRVHKFVQEGRIAAFRVGNAWLIEEEALERFKRTRALAPVLAFPSVSRTNAKGLPDCPGIYFVINDGDECVYVGSSSISLRSRFSTHHRRHQFGNEARIHWIAEPKDLRGTERLWIKALLPRLNRESGKPDKMVSSHFSCSREAMRSLRAVCKRDNRTLANVVRVVIDQAIAANLPIFQERKPPR